MDKVELVLSSYQTECVTWAGFPVAAFYFTCFANAVGKGMHIITSVSISAKVNSKGHT